MFNALYAECMRWQLHQFNTTALLPPPSTTVSNLQPLSNGCVEALHKLNAHCGVQHQRMLMQRLHPRQCSRRFGQDADKPPHDLGVEG